MAGKLNMRLLDSVKEGVGTAFDEPFGDKETSHVVHDQTILLELAQLKSVLLGSIDHGAETLGMTSDQDKVQGQFLLLALSTSAEQFFAFCHKHGRASMLQCPESHPLVHPAGWMEPARRWS